MKKLSGFTFLFAITIVVTALMISCSKKGDKTLAKPTVSITSITNVSSGSAKINANISSTGNGTVTESGICYSTSVNPDLNGLKVTGSPTNGKYTCALTGLLPETTYYVRAYATNESGTTYGNELTFLTSALKFWIPDANLRVALKLQIPLAFDNKDSLKISNASVTGFRGSIDVSNKNIASLSGIEYFIAITQLNCSYNLLTTIDVSKNTALTGFNCSVNQLTSLDVSKNTALNLMVCFTNKLTVLDVSKNTTLGILDCDDNLLTGLDLSKNTALNSLFCYANRLTSLDISSQSLAFDNLYIIKDNLTMMNSGNTGLTTLKVNSVSNQDAEIKNVKTSISGCVISTWSNGIQVCGNYNPVTNSCP